jgi:hypothetical protein
LNVLIVGGVHQQLMLFTQLVLFTLVPADLVSPHVMSVTLEAQRMMRHTASRNDSHETSDGCA